MATANGPILVTGSAGAVGRATVAGLLARGHQVRGYDRVPTPDATESIIADIQDGIALNRAAQGVSAIIHLAAIPDEDDFLSKLLPNNIVGLYHVLEAARCQQVTRVFLASTGQVIWWQLMEGPFPIKPDGPYSPRDWYAVTKVASEAAGQSYARRLGITVLSVRLGWFPRTCEHAQELAGTDRGPNIYLSPGDVGRFFARAVEVHLDPGFSVVFAASRPISKVIFDLEPTKRLLNWEPEDQWPTGCEELLKQGK